MKLGHLSSTVPLLCLWAILGWLAVGGSGAASEDPPFSTFSTFGYAVTGGAAPGYVEDAACEICHREIAEAYQEVGMARSFAPPESAVVVEKFTDEAFYHDHSRRFYRMRRSTEGEMIFERWQVDPLGQKINAFTTQVDWVVGSGHTSRVYLYRTPDGELYQLPLAWYSQGEHWAMAPGYDNSDHNGVYRRVQRECMFCHNAYPDVPAGSDLVGKPHRFPEKLPHGTGCQRCHGPGASHVAMAFAGELDEKKLQGSIVNPGRLSPERRNDVCYGCHLQPTVELMGVRRFERPDYSFRPGEALSDYMVLMDVAAENLDAEDRFEINHHPYRLEQSECFRQSAGELSCLSCHDPHRKVPVDQRPEHYRNICLSCHESSALSPDRHADAEGVLNIQALDCVSCHMPRRRTRDVVHVAMTDHKIQKGPADPDWLQPLEETQSVLVDLSFYRPEEAPKGALGEAYRALAVLKAGGGAEALEHLEKQLNQLSVEHPAPYLSVLRSQLQTFRWQEAGLTAADAFARFEDPLILEWWALALAQLGRSEQAEALLEWAIEKSPERAELHYNLGNLLIKNRPEEPQAAISRLRKALELRPNLAVGWSYLAQGLELQGNPREAESAYRQALSLDPTLEDAYVRLSQLMLETDRPQQAGILLRHALDNVLHPERVREMLSVLSATTDLDRQQNRR